MGAKVLGTFAPGAKVPGSESSIIPLYRGTGCLVLVSVTLFPGISGTVALFTNV